jgi:hypothetical protein
MMKGRVKAVASFAVAEFSPLIGFLVLSWTFGVKVAIAGTVAIVIADSIWRLRRRVPFTRTYILFVVLTIGFGIIDLLSATPFMLKYEAVITNVVTAGVFVLGAAGPKPLVQEVAEQREGRPFSGGGIRMFFRWFTLFGRPISFSRPDSISGWHGRCRCQKRRFWSNRSFMSRW